MNGCRDVFDEKNNFISQQVVAVKNAQQ